MQLNQGSHKIVYGRKCAEVCDLMSSKNESAAGSVNTTGPVSPTGGHLSPRADGSCLIRMNFQNFLRALDAMVVSLNRGTPILTPKCDN